MQPNLSRITHKAWIWLSVLTFLSFPAFSNESSEHRMKLIKMWEYPSQGAIDLAPVIRNDIVLALPSKKALHAFDKNTGHLIWKFNPPEGLWSRAFQADVNTVYVATRNAKLVALEIKTGYVRWQAELGYQLQIRPLIHQQKVYVASTQIGPGLPVKPERKARLLALDAENGKLIWKHETIYYAMQTPAIYGDTLFIGGSYYDPTQDIDEGGPMAIQARFLKDGKLKWTSYGEEGFVKTIYADNDRVAFVGYQDFVIGLDSKTGKRIWKKDTGNWVPALTGQNNMLFYGSANTMVHAQKMSDGEKIWKYNIPWGSFNYILGEPVVDRNRLIFLTQRGHVVAVNIRNGYKIWSADSGMNARTGLALSKDVVIIGDDQGLIRAYRFSQRNL